MKRLIAFAWVFVLLAGLTPATASAQGSGQIHVVQPGENLFRIALRYRVSVQALASINGISNPALVYVGQTLIIPAYGDPASTPQVTDTPILPTSTPQAASAPILPTSTLAPEVDIPTPQPTVPISDTTSLPEPGPTVSETVVTVTPTSTPLPPTSTPAPRPTQHTVAAGENLFRIALRYGLTTEQLAAANGILNPSSVRVGQVLRIPGLGQIPGIAPAPNPAAGGGKKIVISISRQHLWAYSGDKVVFSFVASTGMAKSPTAPGTYKVLDKIPMAYASTWNLQMPYWLGIYYVGRIENGIHALPILSNGQRLWAGLLGRPASFGCVILDTAAAKKLYDWADIGTPVVIQP